MSKLNYELSLLNSPYFDKLIKEMKLILEQKRKLLFGIKNTAEFNNKLSYAEKGIYGSIVKREEELLLEMIHIKGWSLTDNSENLLNTDLSEDFDVYDTNSLSNFS